MLPAALLCLERGMLTIAAIIVRTKENISVIRKGVPREIECVTAKAARGPRSLHHHANGGDMNFVDSVPNPVPACPPAHGPDL